MQYQSFGTPLAQALAFSLHQLLPPKKAPDAQMARETLRSVKQEQYVTPRFS